jgi:hypothetical protein
MNDQEIALRHAIVKRVNTHHYDFSRFLNGEKAAIDSWLGDAFPNVLRELKFKDYEHWRKQLFID